MKRVSMIIFSIAFLWSLCSVAYSADLIFFDDFERAEIGSNWITGSGCGTNTITIVNGSVQATDNCNYIETMQEFSGNVRVEVDIEKIGTQIHSCWDFVIELIGKQVGIVRFDHDSVDGIAIFPPMTTWDCEVHVTTFGSAPNKGKAIYTFRDGTVDFEFINEDMEVLFSNSGHMENFYSTRLRISLAGFSDTPRYVDNVKVYSLPTFPISDLNKDGDVDGTDLGNFAEDFGINAAE